MALPVDELLIDSHKLIFHPHRVSRWLDGENTYPIYMEISTTGLCNHRCTFCSMDHLGYRSSFPDSVILKKRITELGNLGVGSIMFGGDGEPLLNRDIVDIVQQTRTAGIDVALTSNGVLLVPELADKLLPEMHWIKVSLNAGTPETYAKVHRTVPDDFHKVFSNLQYAASFIDSNKLSCTLGAQAVLLPENADEMENLALRCRDAGLHYLVIKPYAQHPKSLTRIYEPVDYTQYLNLAEKLIRFNDDRFKVIFRMSTFNKLKRTHKGYDRCLALPFWSYIDAVGNVYGCSDYLGDDRFLYGNIHEETFQQIWQGERRQKSLEFVANKFDLDHCTLNCRMDDINFYLWKLTHPSSHFNFI